MLIGTMAVRNEAWVLPLSIPAALSWCRGLVILLHRCTDASANIVQVAKASYGDRVQILVRDDEWDEMDHRQAMLEAARGMGATHIAITDADEVLAHPHNGIIDAIDELQPGACLQVPMRNVWRSLKHYRHDGSVWGNARTTLAFRDHPRLCWASADGYQHHHREPMGSSIQLIMRPRITPGVLHLQFANWERLTAKHAWYKMMERARWPSRDIRSIDKMYSQALDESGLHVEEIPDAWWGANREFLEFVDVTTPRDWHNEECERMEAEFGSDYFAGLNLWGVACGMK